MAPRALPSLQRPHAAGRPRYAPKPRASRGRRTCTRGSDDSDGVTLESACDELRQAEVLAAGEHLAHREHARVVLQARDELLERERLRARLGGLLDAVGEPLGEGHTLLLGVVGLVPAAFEVRGLDEGERRRRCRASAASVDAFPDRGRGFLRQRGELVPTRLAGPPVRRLLVGLLATGEGLAVLRVALGEGEVPREPGWQARLDLFRRDDIADGVEAIERVAEPVEFFLERDRPEEVSDVCRVAVVKGARRSREADCQASPSITARTFRAVRSRARASSLEA